MITNPYTYNIIPQNNEFKVKIYYEGKLIDIQTYDNSYTYDEVGSQVKYKIKDVGFNDSNGKFYPPFDEAAIVTEEEFNQSTSIEESNQTLIPTTSLSLSPYSYNVTGDNIFGWELTIFYNGVKIDLEKYNRAKNYFPTYTFIDSNGTTYPDGDKSVKAWAEFLIKDIGFEPEYPPLSSTTSLNPPSSTPPTSTSTTPPPPPVTESISNNKGEVVLDVAPLNNVNSNNPYFYTIEKDYGYAPTTSTSQKGWKVFILYNGTPINLPPDGPLRLDLSRNYDEVVEFVERKIRKTGFTDINNQTYPPFELQVPKAIITAPGYETQEIPLIKGDGTPKELGVIQMTPIDKATEIDKIEAAQFDPKQLEDLISSSTKTPEHFAQKKLIDLIINLKNTALPLAITLISSFGITQASKLIEKGKNKASDLQDQLSCPTNPEILDLISRKNKLVKQLNNSLKTIDKATQILGITGNVITTLEIAFRVLKNLPIPSSVPPGVGLPVNVILGIQDSKDTIDKTITRLKTANASILIILVIVRQILTQLLQYLSLLDSLIQECSPDTEITQETVSDDLLVLTQDQSNESSPLVTNVNGFEMGVETEPTTNSLKRRRALARNKQGVIMLKGEWSFSSIDQILIDELVFYIQQNNLKAD